MSIDHIQIGKRELRIMTLACNGTAETSAEATVESLKAKGLIEVEDSWLLTRGLWFSHFGVSLLYGMLSIGKCEQLKQKFVAPYQAIC